MTGEAETELPFQHTLESVAAEILADAPLEIIEQHKDALVRNVVSIRSKDSTIDLPSFVENILNDIEDFHPETVALALTETDVLASLTDKERRYFLERALDVDINIARNEADVYLTRERYLEKEATDLPFGVSLSAHAQMRGRQKAKLSKRITPTPPALRR